MSWIKSTLSAYLPAALLCACGVPESALDHAERSLSQPAWATADRLIEPMAPGEPLAIQLHLALRNAAAAEAEFDAVSDPDSPRYGQYLSAAEFRERYAPAPADVAAIQRWLSAAGLDASDVSENRLLIRARGTVEQVQAAFGCRLGRYQVRGQQLRAPTTPASVPAALAPLVLATTGLSEVRISPRSAPPAGSGSAAQAPVAAVAAGAPGAPVPPQPGSRDGKPCSRFWDELHDRTSPPYGGGFPDPTPYITCGYTPPRLRAAYGIEHAVRAGNDGRGVTIAILASFAAAPTLLKDAQTYAALHDPAHPLHASSFSALLVPGADPSPPPPDGLVQAWRQDQTTAVEAIHGMAPGARLVYVGARSNQDSDFIAAMNYAIEHDLGSILSNPWSAGAESTALSQPAYRAQAIHAGLRGIGLYFPSGDGGDNGPDSGFPGPTGPDFPASLPEVTAVAGTTLGIGRFDQRLFETAGEVGISLLMDSDTPPTWSPPAPGGYFFGSGGGASRVYGQPRYQRGVVPRALSEQNGAPARVVPDLAIVGHMATGFLLGLTQTFPDGVAYGELTIGDTSLSAAFMSGVMALAEQRHGHRIGFANPALYRAAGSGAFHDIVPGPGPKRAVRVVAYNNGLDDSAGVRHITATLDYAGLTIHPAPGYDAVSGLGSPQGERFLSAIPAR